ncbi:Retrovirus-related Pol polyprotein from transposon 17.6, partial [Mucuna pruriens]
MIAKTKIDVHAETLSMEFGDTLVQFNIFEAMKHPTEDHSLFGIDLINELVIEHFQLDSNSESISNFAEDTDTIDCFGSLIEVADYDEVWEVHNLSDFEDDNIDLDNLSQKAKLIKSLDQVCKHENPECANKAKSILANQGKNHVPSGSVFSAKQGAESNSNPTRADSIPAKRSQQQQPKAEIMSAHLVPNPTQVGQPNPKVSIENSSSPLPPMELKPLPSHLKYAYLDAEQQLPVIIASNLRRQQEDKLLSVLRQHKKAIGWKLSDLLGINPSICMHRMLMEEESKPIRQQQRKMNLTILDMVKKKVTKLLAARIIYPISDSQWVSLVQVIPKKSGMTVTKNQHDELVPLRIQNSWRDHFPLPFIDQVLEKLAGKSHYCFLGGFSGYMQIHIAPEDQHKTTFTYPFGTFAYTRMPFSLCNAPSTFQRCMTSIFSDLLQECMEVYANSFDACLENLSKVLTRCIDTNLVLNFEKCHFMVTKGIVLGHLVSNRGIEVDKAKIEIITSLPNPTFVREVHSFLGHAGFHRSFIKNFSKIALPLSKLLQKDKLKNRLTSAPILQVPNWELPFELMCDASNSALGAVLGQRVGIGKPTHVIAYASRTMDLAHLNYTTIEKELLAIVFALDKFRSYLVGSKIVMFSDQAALRFLLKKPDAKPTLIWWMLLLQEFNIKIRDKKGVEN